MGSNAKIIAIDHDYVPNTYTACLLVREIERKEVNHKPRKVDKPLVLYGAGNLGRMAADYFRRIGIHFQYVVDANPSAHRDDIFWEGIPIFSPEEISNTDRKSALLAVCISTLPFVPLYLSLVAKGWEDVVPFYDIAEAYRDCHPLSNGWFAGKIQQDDITKIEWVLERWCDDISRAHHLQFLAWRSLREEWNFTEAPVTSDDRYFIPQVKNILHDREAFMDVGAHHGEVSIKFSFLTNRKFNNIYAIEPDDKNRKMLCMNFADCFGADNHKVHVLDVVIGENESIGKMYEGLDYVSQVCEFGTKTVNIHTIDKMGIVPTFMKLHLEGGELSALKGGIQTIRRSRPIITATIYHNILGLWEFSQWIMKNLIDYKFYLRLHGWCGTGLVAYAIPLERIKKDQSSV
jgi:FkbM family methyltransferase